MEVDDGRVRVAVLQDASELAAAAAARPLHDPVTGLPQRVLLADRIDQAILAAERAGQPLALLVVHLKLFRTLKDTLGDAFGEQLLVAMVDRLRASLRRSDTLARIGDAELGLLLPGPTDTAFATQVAQWVVQELARPIRVAALEIALEASVGLALYPHHGRRTQELVQRAEIAMLAARSTRRAVAIYPPPADRPSAEEQTLVDELREAIEEGQLFLEFLPKLDLQTNRPDGVEALVRWRHPERGIVPAARFAALAAEHELMLPMTLRVLSLAIAHQRAWHGRGITFSVAINLSSDCLYNPQLMAITDQLLGTAEGRPEALVFEITENMLAQDPTQILEILKGLAAKGYQLALDDFGTGSLSLSVLQKLPVTELKIDRSFVTGMIQDQDAAAVVRSALSLGQSLGLRVVAEGVEDRATLDRLRSWGCTHAQGFFIGTPMTADAFEHWQEGFAPGAPPAKSQPSAGG